MIEKSVQDIIHALENVMVAAEADLHTIVTCIEDFIQKAIR